MHYIYHRQQNKCYPQRYLSAHSEATLDFILSEFTCSKYRISNVILKFHYIVLQFTAVFWQSDTFGGTIYFAGTFPSPAWWKVESVEMMSSRLACFLQPMWSQHTMACRRASRLPSGASTLPDIGASRTSLWGKTKRGGRNQLIGR